MQTKYTSSAPGKLILFGEHAVVYGKPCIVTAVDQRVWVTASRVEPSSLVLRTNILSTAYEKPLRDLGRGVIPKEVGFIEHLTKRFFEWYPQHSGVELVIKSDISPTWGFGSSSASTVAAANALAGLFEITLSSQKLFELCYQVVLDVQGVGSGFDLAAAIWGGTIYYVAPASIVEQLSIPSLPLVVGYTGVKADTPTLIRQVGELKKNKQELVQGVFDRIHALTNKARQAFEQQDWVWIGKLMTENQAELEQLQVSSFRLDELIKASLSAGAFGAKLSGAGGGDCMMAVVDPTTREQVERALVEVHAEVIPIKLGVEGVRKEETKQTKD